LWTTGTINPSSPSETAIPRFTSSCRTSVSSCHVELSTGNSRSAAIVARATNGRYDSRPRAASIALMSASTIVVQCAAVSSDLRMCSPILRRMIETPSAAAAAAGLVGSSSR
jgi:hypothetical protein